MLRALPSTHISKFKSSGYGEGNGSPLQCSCLENPRDGGAQWAAIYGVTRSQTRLSDLAAARFQKGHLVFNRTKAIHASRGHQKACSPALSFYSEGIWGRENWQVSGLVSGTACLEPKYQGIAPFTVTEVLLQGSAHVIAQRNFPFPHNWSSPYHSFLILLYFS